ncbi:MAG TPA: hypothetical protein VHN20_07280 [Beijerinckiaceae bacterium]|nr:hypothetical protein [Beijerinckiaceae bacterium]
MFKKFTTIAIAATASLGAFAVSAESASAGFRGHGFRGGGFRHVHVNRHFHINRHVHFRRHVHWRYGYRWGYRAPIYASGAYAVGYRPCVFVRRPAGVFKVCRVI